MDEDGCLIEARDPIFTEMQNETNRKLREVRGLMVQVRLQRIELLYKGHFSVAIASACFISILQYAGEQTDI